MVEVEQYCGYIVEYNALKKEFQAWKWNKKAKKNEFVGAKPTQEEIEDFIDKHRKKAFRRMPVIIPTYHSVNEVTVTSFDTERDGMIVWTVDEKGTASKHKIGRVYQRTPENLKVSGEIKKRAKQIELLEIEIEELQKEFADPITKENIEVLGGLRRKQ